MSRPAQKYLAAFAKLLAPPPKIMIFDDLRSDGLWYGAVELPETWQVVVGVSPEMFYEIERDLLIRTGERLPKQIEIQHVSGTDMRIRVPRKQLPPDVVGDSLPNIEPPPVLDLRMQPVPREDVSAFVRRP